METKYTYCLHHKFLKLIKRPLCCVDNSGIIFSEKHYDWCDIEVIKERNTSIGVILAVAKGEPRAIISFKDGTSMKIYPNELYFDNDSTSFEFVSGISSAYRELVHTLKRNGCANRFVCE